MQLFSIENTIKEAMQLNHIREDLSTSKENIPMVQWLSRLRLLHGVPFAYLVPHKDFLPHESIRFFYINRNWTDSAIEGALSVGAISTQDRALLQKVYSSLRAKVDQYERRTASQQRGFTEKKGDAEVLTGFLLRSRAVSGWPGLHVRGFRKNGTELELLRMERLAPAVLLVIMDGIPDSVNIDEPRQGIQFGVRPHEDTRLKNQRQFPLRNPVTGVALDDFKIDVPFRKGSPGVIDMNELEKHMIKKGKEENLTLGDDIDSAELALQLLRYPYRQTFGDTSDANDDIFTASIGIRDVVRRQ